jgi:hypothetical protein
MQRTHENFDSIAVQALGNRSLFVRHCTIEIAVWFL